MTVNKLTQKKTVELYCSAFVLHKNLHNKVYRGRNWQNLFLLQQFKAEFKLPLAETCQPWDNLC